MALVMHTQILQERRLSNPATDDELPKKHNEWLRIFQSVIEPELDSAWTVQNMAENTNTNSNERMLRVGMRI
jgi:hypothetical protein